MKKQYLFAEFALLCIFYLIPPLLRSSQSYNPQSVSWHFPVVSVLFFFIALCLYLQITYFDTKTGTGKKGGDNFFRVLILSGYCLTVFGELCVTVAVVELVAFFGPANMRISFPVALPRTVPSFMLCLLSLVFSAWYEETVYRLYVPYAIQVLFCSSSNKKKKFIFVELLPVVLFALGHRYLGIAAVINALFAGIFLRICLKKADNIFPGFIAHFLYNVVILVFQYVL